MTLHNPKDRKQAQSKPNKKLTLAFVVIGLFGGASANAILGNGSLTGGLDSLYLNSGKIISMLEVGSTQTSITPNQTGQVMDGASKASAIAFVAENTARRAQQTMKDFSFVDSIVRTDENGELVPSIVGAGLSSGLNCEALAEKVTTQTKNIVKEQENFTASQRLARLYTYDNSAKQRNRISRHLNNHCDITETASGICPLMMNGQESADTDYSMLHTKDALSIDDVDAASSFTLNIIDPSNTEIEGCDSAVCNQITAVNTSYQAMSNVVHGAFVNQMNDRMYFEYQGTRAGKNLGKDTNIKIGGSEGTVVAGESAQGGSENGDKPLYFGDSIADGYKNENKGEGVTKVGDNPATIYKNLENYVSSNPNGLKGKVVILSTGLSNNTADYDNIRKQMELLKKEGAIVQVLGVSNTYKGSAEDGKAMNKKLGEMSAEYGFKFGGGFEPSSDNVHPAGYKDLKILVKGETPKADNKESATDGKESKTDSKETKTDGKDTKKTTSDKTTKTKNPAEGTGSKSTDAKTNTPK